MCCVLSPLAKICPASQLYLSCLHANNLEGLLSVVALVHVGLFLAHHRCSRVLCWGVFALTNACPVSRPARMRCARDQIGSRCMCMRVCAGCYLLWRHWLLADFWLSKDLFEAERLCCDGVEGRLDGCHAMRLHPAPAGPSLHVHAPQCATCSSIVGGRMVVAGLFSVTQLLVGWISHFWALPPTISPACMHVGTSSTRASCLLQAAHQHSWQPQVLLFGVRLCWLLSAVTAAHDSYSCRCAWCACSSTLSCVLGFLSVGEAATHNLLRLLPF